MRVGSKLCERLINRNFAHRLAFDDPPLRMQANGSAPVGINLSVVTGLAGTALDAGPAASTASG